MFTITTRILLVMALPGLLPAAPVNCASPQSYTEWRTCRALALAAPDGRLQKKLIGASTVNQAAQPSVSESSTSLLDRTSGPDLIGAGLQMLGTGANGDAANKSGDAVVSASAYALYTSFTGQGPLDVDVYRKGARWRRVMFSAGQETASSADATTTQDGGTSTISTKYKVAGVKLLLWNQRDAASAYASRQITEALMSVGSQAQMAARAGRRVEDLIYQRTAHEDDAGQYPMPSTPESQSRFLNEYLTDTAFHKTVQRLTTGDLAAIDRILNETVDGVLRQDEAIQQMLFNIQRGRQLSVAWLGKMTDAAGCADLHRFEAIFDWGLWRHFEITVNGSYDYRNSAVIGGDVRSGRLAGEGRFKLNPVRALSQGVNPWVVAFAGENSWIHEGKDQYKVQGRLEIPIVVGVTLPVSVTFASSSALIKESEVRGQVGFTFDATKVLAALAGR